MKKMAILLVGASLMTVACSGSDKAKPTTEFGPELNGPRKAVYLRASFDDDPTHFIGRFLGNSLEESDIDENRGIQTECSKFVTYKEVNASGTFDEYYNSSTEVTAGFGMNPDVSKLTNGTTGDGNFGHKSGSAVRVQYELTRKLVANIEDPVGFKTCCESSPDNCTDRYIGEFWYGTGELYENKGRSTGGDAKIENQVASGGLTVADGWAWKRATTFNDVFFAFRVTNRTSGEVDSCNWADRPPKSDDGQYFVGVSPASPEEDIARTMAMRHARTQAIQYLGEFITATSSNNASVIEGYVQSENVVKSTAEGMANFVKDDRWCPAEKVETPEGVKYITKVLTFFPNAKKAEAATATVDAVEKEAKAEGKLTPDLKKSLDSVRTKIGQN